MTDTIRYIQSIAASGSGESSVEITDVTQKMEVSLPRVVYFDLELVDTLFKGNQSETVLPIREKNTRTIEPGRIYKVRVSASPNRYLGKYAKQEGIIINSDVEFRLICTESTIHLDERCTVSKDTVSSFDKEFEFTVPEECPRVEIEFGWVYYERIGSEQPKPATVMRGSLEGTHSPTDVRLMEEATVELDKPLPEHVAMLYVERENDEKLCLRGWDYRGHSLLDDTIGWEVPRLADFMEKPEFDLSEDLIDTIQEFSRCGPSKLLEWFDRLLKIHREKLCVVIADHKDSEIPWEILALDHNSYLGALAIVARWKEVKFYGKLRVLKVGNEARRGSVIAYLDNEESRIEGGYLEQETLKKVKVTFHSYLNELQQYLVNLETLDGIGLIYLASYGYKDSTLDLQRLLSEHLKALKLGELREHSDKRPVVFVNAYKSAVLKKNHGGQMDAMLARLASSFIGTLGPVAPGYASMIIKRILSAASSGSNGIQIAEVLRQLRAEAVGKMIEKKRVDDNFVSAFMYVYYGNPLLWLRLDIAGKGEKET